jgi:hypothetical protein
VAVVGDELDVRPALGHAPDEGEVTAYGPQPSRRWYVVIAAINYEDSSRRSLLAHPPDHRIRGLIEGTGERLELLDCNRRRRAHPLHPAPYGPAGYSKHLSQIWLREPGGGEQHREPGLGV